MKSLKFLLVVFVMAAACQLMAGSLGFSGLGGGGNKDDKKSGIGKIGGLPGKKTEIKKDKLEDKKTEISKDKLEDKKTEVNKDKIEDAGKVTENEKAATPKTEATEPPPPTP